MPASEAPELKEGL